MSRLDEIQAHLDHDEKYYGHVDWKGDIKFLIARCRKLEKALAYYAEDTTYIPAFQVNRDPWHTNEEFIFGDKGAKAKKALGDE